MTGAKIPTTTFGGWGGARERLSMLVTLHNTDIAFELPSEVVATAARSSRLTAAARQSQLDATDLATRIGWDPYHKEAGARGVRRILDELVAVGPKAIDLVDELELDRRRVPVLYEKAELLRSAAKTTDVGVRWAIAGHSIEIADALLELLASTVDEAGTLIATLGPMNLTDAVAVASLDPAGQAAYRRLAELAGIADLVREGALELYLDVGKVAKQARRDSGIPEVAETFPIESFVIHAGPIEGPSSKLRGRGPLAGYAPSWRWVPKGQPISRLAALVVAQDADDPVDVEVAVQEVDDPSSNAGAGQVVASSSGRL